MAPQSHRGPASEQPSQPRQLDQLPKKLESLELVILAQPLAAHPRQPQISLAWAWEQPNAVPANKGVPPA